MARKKNLDMIIPIGILLVLAVIILLSTRGTRSYAYSNSELWNHSAESIEGFALADTSELPPRSINNYIDHVIYINLADRTDRKISIEQVLSVFDKEKVTRFDAIKHTHGHMGCSKSHIAALQMAIQNRWKNVMIVEDDMKWNNVAQSYPAFEKLATQPYDVIMIGSMNPLYDPTFKLLGSATLTAYLVNQSYYQTLLTNFQESLAGLENKFDDWQYCIDLYINRLMFTGNWRVVIPSLSIQTPNHSDIRNGHVDYTATSTN